MQSIINSVLNEKSTRDSQLEFLDSSVSQDLPNIDDKLETLFKNKRARIVVAGIGGAGNNAVSRLTDIGVDGAKTIAINTDLERKYLSRWVAFINNFKWTLNT